MEFLNFYAFLWLFFIPLFFYIKSKNLPFSKDVAQKITLKGKIPKKQNFIYFCLVSFYLQLLFQDLLSTTDTLP